MSESIYRALECLSRREALSKATKATFLDTTSGKLYFTYISCAIISIVMAFLWKWTEIESFKLFSENIWKNIWGQVLPFAFR